MVQLDNFVTLQESTAPPQLFRYNRFVSATISAGLADGKTISQGIAEMDKISANVLDDSFRTALTGDSKDFMESSSSLMFAFILAIVLIFLVLSAQFESFKDPIIVMMTVPLALTGALLFMWYFNITMNIFSQIGLIMLIGLVTKNGILIVEFANQGKEAGMSKLEAIRYSAAARFRPILMTSLSTILGILPLALGLGDGAQSRVAMGVAVVGGLTISTVLTLYVVPSIYLVISSETKSIINEPNISNELNQLSGIKHLTSLVLFLFIVNNCVAQEVYDLSRCIKTGLERNFSLRVARNNEEIATNNFTRGNAGMLPTITSTNSFGGTVYTTNQNYEDGSKVTSNNALNNTSSAYIDLGMTIFRGFQVQKTYQKLNEQRELEGFNTQMSVENLVSQIVSQYNYHIQQLILNDNLAYAVSLSRERVRIDQQRYLLGGASKLEMLQSIVYLNSDSSRLENQNEVIRTSQIRLKRADGRKRFG